MPSDNPLISDALGIKLSDLFAEFLQSSNVLSNLAKYSPDEIHFEYQELLKKEKEKKEIKKHPLLSPSHKSEIIISSPINTSHQPPPPSPLPDVGTSTDGMSFSSTNVISPNLTKYLSKFHKNRVKFLNKIPKLQVTDKIPSFFHQKTCTCQRDRSQWIQYFNDLFGPIDISLILYICFGMSRYLLSAWNRRGQPLNVSNVVNFFVICKSTDCLDNYCINRSNDLVSLSLIFIEIFSEYPSIHSFLLANHQIVFDFTHDSLLNSFEQFSLKVQSQFIEIWTKYLGHPNILYNIQCHLMFYLLDSIADKEDCVQNLQYQLVIPQPNTPNSKGITRRKINVLIHEILTYHEGLFFLKETIEFQTKYSDCVSCRVFFHYDWKRVNYIDYNTWMATSNRFYDEGKLGLLNIDDYDNNSLDYIDQLWLSIASTDLHSAMKHLEHQPDINASVNFFSYEHFYVIYCKFWDLDIDHDLSLTEEDLLRYDGHSYSRRGVDAIFDRGLHYSRGNVLHFEDFVSFIFADEDKSHIRSIEYLFNIADFKGDGYLDLEELEWFYSVQIDRIDSLYHEVVPLADVICQFRDIIEQSLENHDNTINSPNNTINEKNNDHIFTLPNFIKCMESSGMLFSLVFSISKYLSFESRDPFSIKAGQLPNADGIIQSDWDRFCSSEYVRLATSEEQTIGQNENGEEEEVCLFEQTKSAVDGR